MPNAWMNISFLITNAFEVVVGQIIDNRVAIHEIRNYARMNNRTILTQIGENMERIQFLHSRHETDLAKLESKVHMEDNRIKADFDAKIAGIDKNIDTVER